MFMVSLGCRTTTKSPAQPTRRPALSGAQCQHAHDEHEVRTLCVYRASLCKSIRGNTVFRSRELFFYVNTLLPVKSKLSLRLLLVAGKLVVCPALPGASSVPFP